MVKQSSEELLLFYQNHLLNDIVPFWDRAVDRDYGGVFTCFNNEGTKLLSKDKYTWSQGRFIWCWSTLYEMMKAGKIHGELDRYAEEAQQAVSFLQQHVLLENGHCAFLLSKEGRKKEPVLGKGYDTSFYADAFVILGFAKYAKVFQEVSLLDWILDLYDSVQRRLERGVFKCEPYPIPEGYQAHGVSMIMLNVTQELSDTLEYLQHPRAEEIQRQSVEYMKKIMDVFCDKEYRMAETLTIQGERDASLLSRHMNPGHTIECMWFVLHTAQKSKQTSYVKKAGEVVKKAFELGWDEEKGGLLRFVDFQGGPPKGEWKDDPHTSLIASTWDYKLWWPHSEALYTTLLFYTLTKEDIYWREYKRVHEYTFHTFPNPNEDIGEWIQIRGRDGKPVEQVVALPVKDPYHILRNLLLIIELLYNQKD
ncbi:MAG: N-acylglucosamine 2-epimerase [Epulopiscium sp.]|nr:N-acylglucosamine 2-epimerase [Candidatus Epulonipiscium sp.]